MPRDMPELSAKRTRRLQSSSMGLKDSRYCDVCNKEFSRPSELKRHLSNTLVHNPSARKYPCQYCGSLHTQKSNLRIHERIHLNELKEICNLPFNETNSTLCDFRCNDPSSMARHVYKVHASPFYDLSRDQIALPPWLSYAMEKRAGTKGGLVQPASPRTPSLSSSPRSSSPRSSTKSNLCTPSPLPEEESPVGQVKTSYFQNNFVPRTIVDNAGGSLPPVHSTLPSVQQSIPHHAAISNAPDFTFDYHQYSAAPALTLPVHHTERPSASTSPALLQSTSGLPHIVTIQDYNADFSIPYITSYRNEFDDRSVIQDVDYFDLNRLESFNQFNANLFDVI